MFLLGGKNWRGPKNFTTNCSFQIIPFFFSVIGNDFLCLYFLPIFFQGALGRHKINSKKSFYLVEKIREAKKVLQQIVHSKLFHSFSLLLEIIFFFYNFCQFSSGALLVDIRLIQKQSFYLVEKTGGVQKILQQIVHSKIFYSFSLLLEPNLLFL